MLKARYYNFAPLLFGGNYYILVIFAEIGIKKRFIFGLQMPDIYCPGPLTRIFESPEKFLVTSLHTHAFRLFAMSDVAQC